MSLAPTPRHEVVMSEIDDTVHEQVKGQRILVYICISVSESEEWQTLSAEKVRAAIS